MAHIILSRPNSGLGFEVKALKTCLVCAIFVLYVPYLTVLYVLYLRDRGAWKRACCEGGMAFMSMLSEYGTYKTVNTAHIRQSIRHI